MAPLPLPVDPAPTPVPAAFVVDAVPLDTCPLVPDLRVVGAVDFVLESPRDGVLILLVVAAFELTDDVPLLTALLELQEREERRY